MGRLSPIPDGTEVHMEFQRPQLWSAKIIRLGFITILPIIFLVGVVGLITGGHTSQGGSLLPFVLGPFALAAFYVCLDTFLRAQAQIQERRLVTFVTDLIA